ncbi:uncharacterized Zn finger protein (UPF0148 family) [Bacillus sp. SORGH_AS 510]|uniref:hypothetical protein n=1 Tax=Bacillus sp. SORGH_AS_0510 TaxID=3041771 RepID=UPI0027883267|nr:hypothetical protein [Bacillus sp. SORGH_AS_0510]MDQ1145372.1 uncharacterized Zn finger protein (UPF0148 family) [Bacillus sp. SORGH_AS_0510]
MYKKTCPKCHKPSFSSCDTGPWTCPTCNNNLTHIIPQDAENRKQSKPRLFLIKNDDLQENPQLNSKIKPFTFESFD